MRRAFHCIITLISVCWSSGSLASAAQIDGVLRDQSGSPIASTTIQLNDSHGQLSSETETNKDGYFQLIVRSPGSYVIIASKENHILTSRTISSDGVVAIHQDLSITSEQTLNVVLGQDQQSVRDALFPKTGTTEYKVDQSTIAALPQGADTPLNKVLLQAPGVAEDSSASGSLHIRGEHANVQYRLNGILLPDGISGFGDTIDSHIIGTAALLDGTLPAQYGFHTAGVVDINTKNGFQNGGTADLMAGSNGVLQPSISYGGTEGNVEYFLAASHLSSNLGIENPTREVTAIHDHTEQNKQFAYASYLIDPMQRVEFIAGNSLSYFQIPNNPNQPTGSFRLNGAIDFNSDDLNERQFESNQYATMAWQGGTNDIEIQIAPYVRNSEVHFRPDTTGDLLFDGIASDVKDRDLATGIQNDNSWRINVQHTVRAGVSIQNDHVDNSNSSLAFLPDDSGAPLVDGSGNNITSSPLIADQTKDGQLYGIYVQDEWKLRNNLTLNYGARFDDMEQYVSANQLSPRFGLVYQPTSTTTLHAGYARYFTPPPMELISAGNIASFSGTTGAPAVAADGAVKPERSNDFDIGASQKLEHGWQIGVDGYYKLVHDLLDEGQFGAAQILTPFNYQRGYIYGSEFTATYTGETLKTYFNLAFSRAMGENIVSSQFNFSDPAELAYIQNHYVPSGS